MLSLKTSPRRYKTFEFSSSRREAFELLGFPDTFYTLFRRGGLIFDVGSLGLEMAPELLQAAFFLFPPARLVPMIFA
jgi:hypothetical protein